MGSFDELLQQGWNVLDQTELDVITLRDGIMLF